MSHKCSVARISLFNQLVQKSSSTRMWFGGSFTKSQGTHLNV